MPDRELPLGRREEDPVIIWNAKKIGAWLGVFSLAVGLISGAVAYLSDKVAKPSEVRELEQSHVHLIQTNQALIDRVEATEEVTADIRELVEILAIDVCLRRANDPFVRQRLHCDTRLK